MRLSICQGHTAQNFSTKTILRDIPVSENVRIAPVNKAISMLFTGILMHLVPIDGAPVREPLVAVDINCSAHYLHRKFSLWGWD